MHKIKLQSPIKIEGVEINELSLRAPKVRDLLAISKGGGDDSEREIKLISNLSEIALEAIQELDLRDYMKIQLWLKDFLSPETEKK